MRKIESASWETKDLEEKIRAPNGDEQSDLICGNVPNTAYGVGRDGTRWESGQSGCGSPGQGE